MKTFLILVSVLVAALSITAQEPDEGDIQVWHESKVYFAPYKKVDSKGEKQTIVAPHFIGVLWFGQDVRHFVTEQIGFGADFRINKNFKFTPSYLYVADQPTKNRKAFEHRIRLEVTASKSWKRFSLSNRNRAEIRVRHSRDDSVRYRNRTKLTIPIKNSEGKEIVAPFVSTEPFYDFRQKEWSRNEFAVGISKKLSRNITGDFYFLNQINTGNTLKRVNVFAFDLTFKID